MLSRIADSLFWLSRYMERNDCLARAIRTNYILSFDVVNSTDYSWQDLIALFAHSSDDAIIANGRSQPAALRFLIADVKNHNSAKALISKARENARGVQDNITKEVWEQVNQLYHIVNHPELEKKITGTRSLETIELLDQDSTLYYGVTDSTMPRGQGWNFMNLGKFVERSLLTIDTAYSHFKKIDHQVNNPQDILFWRNLLLSLSGYELYLKSYPHGQHNLNVIDHIIFNKDFPRSLVYSLNRIKKYLDDVIVDTKMEGSDQLVRTFGRLWSRIEYADMNMIAEISFPQFLQSAREELEEFSNQLSRIYFSYA